MDLTTLLFEVGFGGSLAIVAALLVATFVAFLRMKNDVRRARLFIMADRVKGFLGSFTLGFVVIAVDFLLGVLALPLTQVVSAVAILLFVATMIYGSLQLFLIIRPPRPSITRGRRGRRVRTRPAEVASSGEASEGEVHVSR